MATAAAGRDSCSTVPQQHVWVTTAGPQQLVGITVEVISCMYLCVNACSPRAWVMFAWPKWSNPIPSHCRPLLVTELTNSSHISRDERWSQILPPSFVTQLVTKQIHAGLSALSPFLRWPPTPPCVLCNQIGEKIGLGKFTTPNHIQPANAPCMLYGWFCFGKIHIFSISKFLLIGSLSNKFNIW